MNVKDLRGLLGQGEGPQLDLQHPDADPKAIAQVVCAFLNGDGGRVVVGVAQEGTVEGVQDPEALATHLRHAVGGMVTPAAQWSVDILAVGDASVVLVEVPGGPDRPYVVDGSIWVRRESTTVPAGRDELSALIGRLASAGPRWERQTALGAEWEDLDESLIMDTAERARSSGRWQGAGRDARAFMSGLGLLDAGRISNAGLLLFGRSPSRFLPQARVRLLVLPEGKTGTRYALDREFEGPLLRIALTIEEALLAHVGGVESRFDDSAWRRQDRPLLPRRALDEGVLNALVHRDYA
ncbi:MAG: putative DNA binding domain-containing protein, partial [Candidatus Eisenbacteria bacterium]|nr:putative DNA binding domain-containing protein [Candidatus Eisenbacteria bacterium]